MASRCRMSPSGPRWRGRPDNAQTDGLKGGPGVLMHRTGPDRDHGSEP
jgi:hypothetical protein